jgi:glycosyltransferase involved in cell wall biosynthesis
MIVDFESYIDHAELEESLRKNYSAERKPMKLNIKSVSKGIVQPYTARDGQYFGGVLDGGLSPVKESEHVCTGYQKVHPDATVLKEQTGGKDIPYVDKEVLLLPTVWDHFGHLLVDILSSAWPLLDPKYKDIPIAIVLGNKNAESFIEMIKFLDVDLGRIIIVRKPTQFKNVLIPTSSHNWHGTHPIIADVFRKVMENVPDNPDLSPTHLYLSRTKFKDGCRVYGEQQIEDIFRRNGYQVFYPETMPLADQVQLFRRAKSIALLEGTMQHLSLFMPDDGELIVLERSGVDANGRQPMFSEIKNLNVVHVDTVMDIIPAGRVMGAIPHVVGFTPAFKRFLDARGFRYTSRDLISADIDSWKEYLNTIDSFIKSEKTREPIDVELISAVIAAAEMAKNYKAKPEISVILPVYNAGEYLRGALDSLMGQTFRNWECIAINDGSTDQSLDILREYVAREPRIKIIDRKNGGVSVARNAGLDAAQGNWIMFLDQDDAFDPSAMSMLHSIAIEKNLDLVVGAAFVVPDGFVQASAVSPIANPPNWTYGNSLEDIFETSRGTGLWVWVWSKIYKKELLKGIKFEVGFQPGEDDLFVFDVMAKVKQWGRTPLPVVYHRLSTTSITLSDEKSAKTKKLSIVPKMLQQIRKRRESGDPHARMLADKWLSKGWLEYVYRHIIRPAMKSKDKKWKKLVRKTLRGVYGTKDFPPRYIGGIFRRIRVYRFMKLGF